MKVSASRGIWLLIDIGTQEGHCSCVLMVVLGQAFETAERGLLIKFARLPGLGWYLK